MLKEQLVSWENATFKESRITLQQDGNASHTANLVEEWHNKKMAIVWTKNFGLISHRVKIRWTLLFRVTPRAMSARPISQVLRH